MITITDDSGHQITFTILEGSVEIDCDGWIRISREDARQLRRFLENLG